MKETYIYYLVAFGIVALFFLFFVFRELILWYYRINERLKLADEQVFLLRKIAEKLGSSPEELEFTPKKRKLLS